MRMVPTSARCRASASATACSATRLRYSIGRPRSGSPGCGQLPPSRRDIIRWVSSSRLAWSRHRSKLGEVDALVSCPWLYLGDVANFDADRLQRASRLKVIAGTFDYRLEWLDLDAVGRCGVTVSDTSRTMTPTVGEFGVAITLALLRDIPAAIDLVRAGRWFDAAKAGSNYVFRDFADCRVGVAGYGSINRHYRRFVSGFGCPVSAFDPLLDDEGAQAQGVTRAQSLVELARRSDILVVAIPPTASVLGVIDASVIDALAPGSLFILLSRMAVVEQEAASCQPPLVDAARESVPGGTVPLEDQRRRAGVVDRPGAA
jgi:phosphoglycerate dehydrogenase-like enzyme